MTDDSMEDYTTILNRQVEEQVLETMLTNFAKLSHEEKLSAKKGIYIYGPPGVGKSFFGGYGMGVVKGLRTNERRRSELIFTKKKYANVWTT